MDEAKRPTIALCAIVRNEEDALPGMLESVEGIVSEIVILDTGSTDRTVEIAKERATTFLLREWDDSFANARNPALDACQSDWILILDADERLSEEARATLPAIMDKVSANCDLILMPIDMCRDDGSVYQRFLAERLVRNHKGYKFHGDMHNWIDVPVDPEKRLAAPELTIKHNRVHRKLDARDARAVQRLHMAETKLMAAIKENPRDRRSLFYLAGTYLDSNMPEKAVKWYTRYFRVSDWPAERYQASLLCAEAYKQLGKIEEAQKILSAHLIDNPQRAEALCILGDLARQQQRFIDAEKWYQFASLLPMPLDPMFVEADAHTWLPHQGLFETYAAQMDLDRAWQHGRTAMEQGSPHSPEILKFGKNHANYKSDVIGVLVDRGQMSFIDPIIKHWDESGKEVIVGESIDQIEVMLERKPNLIWCEWAGQLAIELTKLPKQSRIIVRVHGYELNAGYLGQIDWKQIDDVIFVSEHLKDLAIQQCPEIPRYCNTYVVPGGVECDKFTIVPDKDGRKIAMLGYVNARKNIPLALQILVKCPEHELHIAGEWQDAELLDYVNELGVELGVSDRLVVYGRIEDPNEFFADKSFILSTSTRETFHYAVGEGMAAGLKPVIHCWPSAMEFYEDKWMFASIDEAVAMIQDPGQPETYREYAQQNLDISRNRTRIDRIIDRRSIAVSGDPKYKYATEYAIVQALDDLGFRTNAANSELVILPNWNARLEPWMDGAKKLLWHREAFIGDSEKAKSTREAIAPVIGDFDTVATFHPDGHEILRDLGAKNVSFIHNVGIRSPWRKLDTEKQYDIGFYGFMTERRKAILDELGKEFNIKVFENYDHEQLNLFVNQCRVILNLHAWDMPIIEDRIGDCMAAGVCVVSEKLPDGHPFPDGTLIEAADTDGLKSWLKAALVEEDWRQRIERKAYKWMWNKCRFYRQVEKLVELTGF